MISADVSTRLLEVDGAGIEAVLVGYRQRHIDAEAARQYIRLARLGMHAAVTALAVGKPADLTWPDEKLGKYLKEIKAGYEIEYDRSKRVVHGSNYGLTVYGLTEKFPEAFPTLAAAQRQMDFLNGVAPALAPQQHAVRWQAHKAGFLGGPTLEGKTPTIWDHEYGYRHWFWDVLSYKPTTEFVARKWALDRTRKDRVVYLHGRPFTVAPGNDWNRAVAFYPQSTAAGWLKEKQLRLFTPWSDDYIGDCYFGRTPLLGPIHDSLLLMIPNRIFDRVLEIVARVMQEPSERLPIPLSWNMGPHLPIGVSAKAGKNWAPALTEEKIAKIQAKAASEGKEIPQLVANPNGMEDIEIPQWVPHVADEPVLPEDADDQDQMDDWRALERHVA